MFGHIGNRRAFEFHHVAIKLGWSTHGLAGVIHDVVKTVVLGHHVMTKSFNARRVAKVKTVDLEAMTPISKICFCGITHRRISWETRRHNEVSSGAQQFDSGLVTNLHSATGE